MVLGSSRLAAAEWVFGDSQYIGLGWFGKQVGLEIRKPVLHKACNARLKHKKR